MSTRHLPVAHWRIRCTSASVKGSVGGLVKIGFCRILAGFAAIQPEAMQKLKKTGAVPIFSTRISASLATEHGIGVHDSGPTPEAKSAAKRHRTIAGSQRAALFSAACLQTPRALSARRGTRRARNRGVTGSTDLPNSSSRLICSARCHELVFSEWRR